MDTWLEAVWIVLLGGTFSVAAKWGVAYYCANRQDEMFLSTDERVSLARTEALQEELARQGFSRLNRRQIWRRVNWIWKSARVIALNSGHLPAIAGLAVVGVLAALVAFKTILLPKAADLGAVLGGKEFIFYLVSSRRSVSHSESSRMRRS